MTNEELCLRYQAGDSTAAEELIAENRAFIHEVSVQFSKQYTRLPLEVDDYDQEGSMALLRAAERFDPDKGSFLPFARLAIRNAFIDARSAWYIRMAKCYFRRRTLYPMKQWPILADNRIQHGSACRSEPLMTLTLKGSIFRRKLWRSCMRPCMI